MEKELSLLDSICEAYNNSMSGGTRESKEEFLREMETILYGVQQTLKKMRVKHNEERICRRELINKLQIFVDMEREYASAIRQFTKECEKSELLHEQLQWFREREERLAKGLSSSMEEPPKLEECLGEQNQIQSEKDSVV